MKVDLKLKTEELQKRLVGLEPLRVYQDSVVYRISKWSDANAGKVLITTFTALALLTFSLVFVPISTHVFAIIFAFIITNFWFRYVKSRAYKQSVDRMKQEETNEIARLLRDFTQSEYVVSLEETIVRKKVLSEKPSEMAIALHSGDSKDKAVALKYVFGDGIHSFVESIELIESQIQKHKDDQVNERELKDRKKALNAI